LGNSKLKKELRILKSTESHKIWRRKCNSTRFPLFFISYIFLFLALFSSLIILHQSCDQSFPTELQSGKYQNLSSISISGNNQFAPFAISGNGSINDPYILENYRINASYLGVDGICIENTNVYFILRNCTIFGANGAGIMLMNVTHGNITNNTLQYNYQGIRLSSAQENNFSRLIVTSCHYGFYLSGSSGNRFYDNQVVNSSSGGFELRYSSNSNLLLNNTVISSWDGIEIALYSSDNIIINNTLKHNLDGIQLFKAEKNTVYGNKFHENGIYISGDYLSHYTHDIFSNNTINDRPIYYYNGQKDILVPNNASQVILVNCSEMVISNTNFTLTGISLFYTNQTRIQGNNISFNRWDGIHLFASRNNTITQNILIGNNSRYHGIICVNDGISLYDSDNNTISHNIANFNRAHGIKLQRSNNNTLLNNTAIYNGGSGIYLEESAHNRILNTCASYNSYAGGWSRIVAGIFLWDSQSNEISFCNLSYNEDYGLYLGNSSQNQIRWNTIHWNEECIFENEFCFSNIKTNNNCLMPPKPLPSCFWFSLFLIPSFGGFSVLAFYLDKKEKDRYMHPTSKEGVERVEMDHLKIRLKLYKIFFILEFFCFSIITHTLYFPELFQAISILEFIGLISLPTSIGLVLFFIIQVRLNRQFKKVFNEDRKSSPYLMILLFAVVIYPSN
jgi:parallel beta-helix repeat protein